MSSQAANPQATRVPRRPPPLVPEHTLTAPQWGMLSFLLSEVAFFSTLIVAYIALHGSDVVGPTPEEALRLPLVIVGTACLVMSSFTMHLAERALDHGFVDSFRRWLWLTIALGVAFLVGTAYEWHELITVHQLTISRNLFGTTYYTLVGFHALHVTMGVVVMLIFAGLAGAGQLMSRQAAAVQLVSWYWHFVDAVWIIVFLVVYI